MIRPRPRRGAEPFDEEYIDLLGVIAFGDLLDAVKFGLETEKKAWLKTGIGARVGVAGVKMRILRGLVEVGVVNAELVAVVGVMVRSGVRMGESKPRGFGVVGVRYERGEGESI